MAIPAASAAPPRVVLTLVDPTTLLTPEPPLTGIVTGESEPRIFQQRVNSKERIAVGVDSTGRPVSLVATQRLRVLGKGDYLFTITAPVRRVTATADSESIPGQRNGAILWAGFSPGNRRLGAVAVLDPSRVKAFLPLRLVLSATVDGRPLVPGERASGTLRLSLTLRNTTRTKAPSAAAAGDRGAIVRALDAARQGVYPLGGVPISVRTPVAAADAFIEAPLRVEGELRFDGGTLEPPRPGNTFRFATVLGDGRPSTRTVVSFTGHATGITAPKLRVVAQPVLPHRTLEPPSGGTWAEAARRDPPLDSKTLLTIAENGYLRAARAKQFDTFLLNPGPAGVGVNTAQYVYVTAPPRAIAAPVSSGGGGLGTVGIALVALGGLAAMAGVAVAWAYL